MRTFLLIILLLVLAVVVYFFILGGKSKAGVAAGLVEGQLSQCGSKPNCVCSEQKEKGEHYAEPLPLAKMSEKPMDQVAAAIKAAGGQVDQLTDSYLSATFASGIFGFVDDFEARVDVENGLLHLRSASRVGHSDLGANRKRVEAMKAVLQGKWRWQGNAWNAMQPLKISEAADVKQSY